MNETILIGIFCDVDDFVQQWEPRLRRRLLERPDRACRRERSGHLSCSEVMTILIAFQQSGYRTFKHFYTRYVHPYWRTYFPTLLSYTRFLALIPRVLLPMCMYLKTRYGTHTGLSFIDSTKLAVCHPKRIRRNRVFQGIAQIGKSSMGWFFGFKLHLLINDQGELLGVHVTPGNVDDRTVVADLTDALTGKLFGDKGYLSQSLLNNSCNGVFTSSLRSAAT